MNTPCSLENDDDLAHATFTITGDRVVPRVWSDYFGVEPDICIEKGKPFKTPSGRISSSLGRVGVWGCRSKGIIAADTLDPHIRYLMARLGLPRLDLPEKLRQSQAWMRILCFWSNYGRDRVAMVDPQLKQAIESSGGVIEIDEYPQLHRFVDANGNETDVWV